MVDDEEEALPQQQEDDGDPEDRGLLLEQLRQLGAQPGAAAALFQAGYDWLQGGPNKANVVIRAEELEVELEGELDNPLLVSQFDRLQDGLADDQADEVLYALLGLGYQLKSG
jgi:hypothetical protein